MAEISDDAARQIIEAIRSEGEWTRESIDRLRREVRSMDRNIGAKIDGQTEVIRDLVKLNSGMLALLERADIKIAD